MPDILDQIRDWARSLKYWEQATLEKISTGEKLTDQDYQELVTLWEQDAGLAHVPALRPQLAFTSGSTHASGRPKTRLVRLHNLVDVNALPNGQELPFGLQLTLIFGANGAGKRDMPDHLDVLRSRAATGKFCPMRSFRSQKPSQELILKSLWKDIDNPFRFTGKPGRGVRSSPGFMSLTRRVWTSIYWSPIP